jgi:hypothetical protein
MYSWQKIVITKTTPLFLEGLNEPAIILVIDMMLN